MPSTRQRRGTKSHLPDIAEVIPESMLNEEISRMLRVSNDYENMNLIRFNFSQREFKPITVFDTCTMLIEGNIDYKSVEDSHFALDKVESVESEEEIDNENKIEEKVPQLVKNQFNFSDRGSQTVDCRPRHQLMETEPPATATFSGYSTQWSIYDAYVNKNKNQEFKSEPSPTTLHPCVSRLAAIVERMVLHNIYDYLLQDYKYYEDPADDFQGHIGSLLPLWKFTSEETEYLSVTSMCWSPHYTDLFAVSFGTFTLTKQGEGAILLYSLKNPSYPTHTFLTECGVTTVDFNRKFSYYLAAGFYDGSVAVYNLSLNRHKPELQSESGVHTMYVSQIQWEKNPKDDPLSYYSVSPDGLIIKWTLAQNSLKYHVLVTLDVSDFIEKSMLEMKMMTFGSGITIDFNAVNNQIYLVGTEMGHGHLCMRAHSTEALQTFEAHDSSIYKIAWNTFHPKIFITCSEDWTVKIWEHKGIIQKPLLVFDLGSQVYDVEWAPFSSTVFAAVTAEGQVFVYDIAIDKNEPLCEQVVVFLKLTRVMHLAFNKEQPCILVGDDRGEVTCLKLSPNLRKAPKDKKGHAPTDKKGREQFEITRLNEILATVR